MRGLRIARRSRRLGNDRGQALVEFALAVPIVLVLMFGIMEFSRHYYARLTLQHAVSEAARFATTGGVLPDSVGDPMSRAKSITTVIARRASTLNVDVDGVTLDPADGGGPGDVLRVSADFTFNFLMPGVRTLFPDGSLRFSVSTALKNEPYFPPIPSDDG